MVSKAFRAALSKNWAQNALLLVGLLVALARRRWCLINIFVKAVVEVVLHRGLKTIILFQASNYQGGNLQFPIKILQCQKRKKACIGWAQCAE